MLIALLTDLHGNLEATTACLNAAEGLGAQRLVILGDLVGYGADPVAVTRLVMARAAAGAIILRGNHDEAALAPTSRMTADAEAAMAWTRRVLDEPSRAFLAGLPMLAEEEGRLYVHADASAPAEWRYVTDTETARRSLDATAARLTFVGHTHRPRLFRRDAGGGVERVAPGPAIALGGEAQWLCVLGAVGQPRDENPAAFFAMFDTASASLTWHRVVYDVATAAAKIIAAGLPERLATRLARGS